MVGPECAESMQAMSPCMQGHRVERVAGRRAHGELQVCRDHAGAVPKHANAHVLIWHGSSHGPLCGVHVMGPECAKMQQGLLQTSQAWGRFSLLMPCRPSCCCWRLLRELAKMLGYQIQAYFHAIGGEFPRYGQQPCAGAVMAMEINTG